MRGSSASFERVCILEPGPSSSLRVWWLALHLLLGAAVAALGAGTGLGGALLAAVVVHGVLRRPHAFDELIVISGGRWSIPALGLFGAGPTDATICAATWARLVLASDRASVRVLVYRDQFRSDDWRRLRTEVSRRV
jgi:hypothetical protein